MNHRTAAGLASLLVFIAACGNGNPAGPGSDGTVAVLVGAGDIGECGSPGPAATARLLDAIGGTVFTAGDNAYPFGSVSDFRDCYHPWWGRHRGRTRPSPGNHDYETPGASAYFEYFGDRAGPPGLGYYSYTVGDWLVLSLNSEVPATNGSPQLAWVRAALDAQPRACTAAYWHRPRFSSGPHGNRSELRDLWRVLHEAGADIVIAGHDHLYERFAPMDANGNLDTSRGIRQFTVGTGGATLYEFARIQPNSEARGNAWGVLKLTLRPSGYDWVFVPVQGASLTDSGSRECH